MIAARGKDSGEGNTIWYNPPYNAAVSTNIGRKFIKLIDKHFPKGSKLHKVFNRNNIKISYSCMPNVASIIKSHNRKVLSEKEDTESRTCSCRVKASCPIHGNCTSTNVVYSAEVTREDNQQTATYIGLTENKFKTRYNQHQHTFRHNKYRHSTELSNYIWDLKDSNTYKLVHPKQGP